LIAGVEQPAEMQAVSRRPLDARNVFALQRTIGNAAVRGLLQRDEGDAGKKAPSKTLYMGMNPGAKGEAKALRGILKDDVIAAMNDPALEKSLETDAGIAKWMKEELPALLDNPLQFYFAYVILQETSPAARDQMAQVIQMFHAAETGKLNLERIVLSGHSNGVQLWGDEAKNFNPGSFVLDTVFQRLTSTFAKAAAQVEDVMFSACYTVSSMELVVKAFPNLRTVWGYAGASPAAGAGAEAHIAKWEKETRGDQTLDAKDGRGKAALWTRDAAASSKKGSGFIRNDPANANLQEMHDSFYGLSLSATQQIQGEIPINQTILNQAYALIQAMLVHPDLKDEAVRTSFTAWSNYLLRMRYYSKVCGIFASKYSAEIKRGYAAIGRAQPNFNSISRAALKAERDAFEAALATTPNAEGQAFLDGYLEPFWKLNPELIEATWI
jgi:hypothetical protein